MFENATLVSAPPGKRVWTTFLGMTSQVFLVGSAVLVPMVFPQALPYAQLPIALAPPVPSGPPRGSDPPKPHPIRRTVARLAAVGFYAPPRVPDRVTIDPEPVPGTAIDGALPGDARASIPAVWGAFFNNLVPAPAVAPPVARAPVEPAAPAPIEKPQRLREGGRFQLGRLLRRVEPAYPPLARTTRASGLVVLECVVGIDGRIKNVKIVSGHPLLVNAARDAVWQWVYEASRLNGVPTEIIARISVNFKLN
jgi:periplasmic protein TonB